MPPAPPPGEPQAVAGLDAQHLKVAFGEPAFVRKEGTIQLWRYDGSSCRAFFFLYLQGSGLVVRHVETVPRGRDMAADETCLATLKSHATAPAAPVS